MKQGIIFLSILFIAFCSKAQMQNNSLQGNDSTKNGFRGVTAAKYGLQYSQSFVDTATANSFIGGRLKGIPGLEILVGNVKYIRSQDITKWIKSSASAIMDYWSIFGNPDTDGGSINFLGTTNEANLTFLRYNTVSGRLGANNTSFGYQSMPEDNGSFNSGFGVGSLNAVTGGMNNSGFGAYSLNINGSGDNNTALGSHALENNSSGSGNIGIGYKAGKYSVSLDNRLYISSIDRTNVNGDSTKSIIYGLQGPDSSAQKLTINGKIRVTNVPKAVGLYAARFDASGNLTRADTTISSGGTNSNIGSGYRWAVPGTNNIKTHFAVNGLTNDSTSNSNAITTKLGGTLIEGTIIDGAGNDFSLASFGSGIQITGGGNTSIGDINAFANGNTFNIHSNNGYADYDNPTHDVRFGINESNPDSTLTVKGGLHITRGVRFSGLPTGVGTKSIRIDASGHLSIADTTITSSFTLTNGNGTTASGSSVNLGGNLTSNTTVNGATLDKSLAFEGTVTGLNLQRTAAGLSQFGNYNASQNGNTFTIDDANALAYYDNTAHTGFFGINKNTPVASLDINGNLAVNDGSNQGIGIFSEASTSVGGAATRVEINGNTTSDNIIINSTNGLLVNTGGISIGTGSAPTSGYNIESNNSNIKLRNSNTGITTDASTGQTITGDKGGIAGNGTTNIVDDNNQKHILNKNVQFSDYGAGALTTDIAGNITATSDERLKNIQGYSHVGLKEVMELRPINYKWNGLSRNETEGIYTGFSAQNVRDNIPNGTGVMKGKEGYLTLQDRAVLAAAIVAIQDLKKLNDAQQKQINSLKKQLKKKK